MADAAVKITFFLKKMFKVIKRMVFWLFKIIGRRDGGKSEIYSKICRVYEKLYDILEKI